ncbi:hypothetical protein Cha6605_3876 [Chamaesiphon minutus PCC 6605]|uniref:Uncharacterized protein n=1 Tax=Chamaesiphon minutus (strain ATCC 27169 / PCC 6605) TaxID=1173020 RepID=K9UKY7_CHAP6|nr:hypothetical protein Cha6605_3876 [Chamaesiphon minutus PCC 6605]
MNGLKSFYTLELYIEPGGARRDTKCALGSLAEIKQAI